MVTRNPCLHPGDVRRLVAVDTPALHHLVDCIVFPSVGPRPHPNEMSGVCRMCGMIVQSNVLCFEIQ